MTPIIRSVRFVAAVALVAVPVAAPVRAAEQPTKYAGRSVAAVLKELQSAELRILFSSELVPQALRVKVEPKGRDPREIALQVLQPHGLTLQKGPGGTELVVALPRAASPAPRRRETPPDPTRVETAVQPPPPPDPLRIEEHVEVAERLKGEIGHPRGYSIEPSAILETAGGFENIFQVFPVLPGVAATNDEDGRIAVRGAGPEHNLIVLDGVQIHNPYRFGELTSSFLNPATTSRVTLDASGLDAGHGGRLSSVTIVETRDGRRDRKLAVSGTLGVANGDVLLEGRLPGSQSGSWWVTARGTYYRLFAGFWRSGALPGFGDVQFKLTTRPSKRTALSMFGLIGRETMHYEDDDNEGRRFTTAQFRGTNRLGVANLSWTPSARLMTTSTLSLSSHDARDFDSFGRSGIPVVELDPFAPFARDVDVRDVAVRERAVYAMPSGHVLEAGVEWHRLRSSWRMAGVKPPIFWRGIGPSTWGEGVEYPPEGFIESRLARTQAGVWIQMRVPIASRAAVEPGGRVDWNSFTNESTWQPRLRVTARAGATTLWAGFAAQAQTPSHESLQGFEYFHFSQDDGRRLRNERSRQISLGLERPLGAGFDLRAEVYHRRFDRLLVQQLETDAERARRLSFYELPPNLPPDSSILEYRRTIVPESTGRGTARGLEVLVRRTGRRLSGWVAYTFSKTTREAHGNTFPFDFDRPHALTATATGQLSRRLRLSATWLQASGFPTTPLPAEVFFTHGWLPDGMPDPIARPAGTLRAPNPAVRRQSLRNTERLGTYSRTDVRATYSTLGRWEFYGEVINVFGTRNYLQTIRIPSISGPEEFTTSNNVYENLDRIPTFGVRVTF